MAAGEYVFVVPVQFNKNEARGFVLQVLGSAPSSPVEGQAYFNSTTNRAEIWDGTQWIDMTSRAFHTGTQLAATISDLAATVKAYRLDEFADPTSDIPMNGQKLSGLGAPSAANDSARLVDVQGVSAGLNWKDSVRAATAVAGTLATSFENGDAIDGVTLVTNDRILIKNQAAPAENGVYIVQATGAPVRADDANSAADVLQATVFVEEGTANADTAWVQTTNAPITLETTGLTFVQFGASADITAGTGLTKTGNTVDAIAGATPGSGGPGGGLVANADDLVIDTVVVVRKFADDVGDAAATQFDVTHGLGTRDVTVQIRDNATPWGYVFADVEALSTSAVRVRFAVAPTTDQYRVIVHG